jgi:hypothetical protein
MTRWIYETPDGGKTLYRRPLCEATILNREIQVSHNVWFRQDQLMELGRETYRQQNLRHEFPVLQELWDQYHTMLDLLSHEGALD